MNFIWENLFKMAHSGNLFFWMRFGIYISSIIILHAFFTFIIYKKIKVIKQTEIGEHVKLIISKIWSLIIISLINSVLLFCFIRYNGWISFDFLSFSLGMSNSYFQIAHMILIYLLSILYFITLKNKIIK
jgi:hypothetical protein